MDSHINIAKLRTVEEVYGFIIPGILCNDSSLIIDADIATSTSEGAFKSNSDVEHGILSPVLSAASKTHKATTVNATATTTVTTSSTTIPTTATSGYVIKGDPTERCIFDLSIQLTGAPQAVKQLINAHSRLEEIPFDSATKYMATLHYMDIAVVARMSGIKLSTNKPGKFYYIYHINIRINYSTSWYLRLI